MAPIVQCGNVCCKAWFIARTRGTIGHTRPCTALYYGVLETFFEPWEFALKGGTVQRRLSTRGNCWSRLAYGSSALVIRGLVIESRASIQDGQTGWQSLRPVLPRLQFMLGMGECLRWGGEVTVCLG